MRMAIVHNDGIRLRIDNLAGLDFSLARDPGQYFRQRFSITLCLHVHALENDIVENFLQGQ